MRNNYLLRNRAVLPMQIVGGWVIVLICAVFFTALTMIIASQGISTDTSMLFSFALTFPVLLMLHFFLHRSIEAKIQRRNLEQKVTDFQGSYARIQKVLHQELQDIQELQLSVADLQGAALQKEIKVRLRTLSENLLRTRVQLATQQVLTEQLLLKSDEVLELLRQQNIESTLAPLIVRSLEQQILQVLEDLRIEQLRQEYLSVKEQID